MKAVIFAAGLGTRLKPLTDTLPKALVPVGGRPLLQHILEKLGDACAPLTGKPLIDGAVINVHHFADKIISWLSSDGETLSSLSFRTKSRNLPVEISDERDRLLETGGGILHARPFLEGCGSFLVHNVDILSNLDLAWFASKGRPDALATLLVSSRRTSRHLLFAPQTMCLAGWTNITTGEVRSPYLKGVPVPESMAGTDGRFDPSRCIRLAFSGIHIISDRIFSLMEEHARRLGDTCFPIMDLYLDLCSTYNIYGVVAEDLELVDVGKLDTLELAENFINRTI